MSKITLHSVNLANQVSKTCNDAHEHFNANPYPDHETGKIMVIVNYTDLGMKKLPINSIRYTIEADKILYAEALHVDENLRTKSTLLAVKNAQQLEESEVLFHARVAGFPI